MHRTEIFALNLRGGVGNADMQRRWAKHNLLGIGAKCRLAADRQDCTVKLRQPNDHLTVFDSHFQEHDQHSYIKIPPDQAALFGDAITANELLVVIVEGVPGAVVAIPYFIRSGQEFFEVFRQHFPTVRLEAYDLPPSNVTSVNASFVAGCLYRELCDRDPELFSVGIQKFLNSTHILSHLFAHSTHLDAQESIVFLEKVRIIADKLRALIERYIVKIEKNHHAVWADYCGSKISFADGGMSRIVSLPGVTPTGLRVGIYTVTPGETDPVRREIWSLQSFMIGDILNDRTIIDEDDAETDEKRIQEAARYLAEAACVERYVHANNVDAIFLHGPIQNKFETYDELEPCYVPGLSRSFLESMGLTEDIVCTLVRDVPKNRNGRRLWSAAIPVYAALQKLIAKQTIPVVGIVERAASTAITRALLELLVADRVITDSARRAVLSEVKKYEIQDELLFGCILETGEYIRPLTIGKNIPRRAHDRWQGVIAQMPSIRSTMIKTADHSFPFRVEFGSSIEEKACDRTMRLIYHTSLLLPNYAFPVGIDIADKYAKVPDWLSKGVSAQLAATIYKKCVQSGNVRLLEQMRNMLGRSPGTSSIARVHEGARQ